MKSYQVIAPDTEKLYDVDFYINTDHVPTAENIVEDSEVTLEEKRDALVGKNTLLELFKKFNIDYENNIIIDTTGNQFSSTFSSLFCSFFVIRECNLYSYQMKIANTSNIFEKKTCAFNIVMNKIRPDRLLTSCWLNNNKQHYDFLYTQSWNQADVTHQLYELLQIGGITDYKNSSNITIETMPKKWIGSEYAGGNATNFQQNVSDVFYQSVFSIVLEPVFWENDCNITEKYLNALYGLTIPIVSGYNSCNFLKSMGFDVFDDIIDTSYQHIENASTRSWQMMELNKTVFSDAKTIIKDKTVQQRIIKNLEWARQPRTLFETAFLNLNSVKEKQFFIDNYHDIKEILLVEQPESMAIVDLDKMYSLLQFELK